VIGVNVDLIAVTTAVTLWAAAVISPGPAFAAIIHRSVSSSRSSALCTVFGITAASGIYGLITIFGLATILGSSNGVEQTVRWVGAAYLIWLGLNAWRHAATPSATMSIKPAASGLRAFSSGLMIEFGNPKGIAFFLSVFALAIPPDATTATKLLTISFGLVFELAWYSGAALLLGSRASRSAYDRVKPIVERIFGTVFVGLGVQLLLSRA
jgi:threonine/homoserine/homoserine lactone efflux protein